MYRSVKGLTGFAQLGVLLAFLGFGFILAGITQLVIAMQIIPAGDSITKDGVLLKALMDPANVAASRIAQVTGTLCLFFIPAYLFSIVSDGVSFRWLGFNKNFTVEQVFLAFFIILLCSFIVHKPLLELPFGFICRLTRLFFPRLFLQPFLGRLACWRFPDCLSRRLGAEIEEQC